MPENEQDPIPPQPPNAAPPADQPLYYPPPNYPPPPQQWPPQPQPYGNYPGYAPVPPVNSTLILVFGIISIVFTLICGFGGIFGIVAWIMGNGALKTLAQVGDPMAQRSTVNAGRICGIIGTILMALGVILYAAYFIFLAVGGLGSSHHP